MSLRNTTTYSVLVYVMNLSLRYRHQYSLNLFHALVRGKQKCFSEVDSLLEDLRLVFEPRVGLLMGRSGRCLDQSIESETSVPTRF